MPNVHSKNLYSVLLSLSIPSKQFNYFIGCFFKPKVNDVLLEKMFLTFQQINLNSLAMNFFAFVANFISDLSCIVLCGVFYYACF